MFSKRTLRTRTLLIAGVLTLSACGTGKTVSTGDDSHAAGAIPPVAPVTKAPESAGLAAGSTVTVQLLEVLDSDNAPADPFIIGRIPDDIMGADGKLAFQAGSHVLMVLRTAGKQKEFSGMKLALYSIDAGGRSIRFTNGAKDIATAEFTEDASQGARHRTVHLGEDTLIPFKLQSAISLKQPAL